MSSDFAPVDADHLQRERRLRVVADRISPMLVLVDLNLNPLGWTPNGGLVQLLADGGDELRHAVAACRANGEQFVHVLNGDIVLRIVPLESRAADYVIIIVESFGHRGSLASAAKLYRLTKREVEILGFVIQGMSNIEIATELFIAHSTVSEHVKSLMRKTKTTKRIHLLGIIAYGGLGEPAGS